MIFLCAIIEAVDDYADLLRLSVATAGNDHRLGANEAPPAIISIFLGDYLSKVLEAKVAGKTSLKDSENKLQTGVESLPVLTKTTPIETEPPPSLSLVTNLNSECPVLPNPLLV